MRNYTKKFKQEMAFFIHPKTGYVTYNEKCHKCIHTDCKQSFRVKVVACRHYEEKRVEKIIPMAELKARRKRKYVF